MEQTEIIKNAIVRTLLESEIGGIESDGTRSMAGNINRSQYHDVADKILKLVVQPVVIKSVCENHGERTYYVEETKKHYCSLCKEEH